MKISQIFRKALELQDALERERRRHASTAEALRLMSLKWLEVYNELRQLRGKKKSSK